MINQLKKNFFLYVLLIFTTSYANAMQQKKRKRSPLAELSNPHIQHNRLKNKKNDILPINRAALDGDIKQLKYLIKRKKLRFYAKSLFRKSDSILHYVTKSNNESAVNLVLKSMRKKITNNSSYFEFLNQKNQDDLTAFQIACKLQNPDLINIFIKTLQNEYYLEYGLQDEYVQALHQIILQVYAINNTIGYYFGQKIIKQYFEQLMRSASFQNSDEQSPLKYACIQIKTILTMPTNTSTESLLEKAPELNTFLSKLVKSYHSKLLH